jgi:CrcB protein
MDHDPAASQMVLEGGRRAGVTGIVTSEIEESCILRSAIAVFIGAGLGGVARHYFNALAAALFGTAFPWGILAINVLGSAAMGVIVEWLALRGSAPQDLRLFLTTGILGGFTTFSTFSLDAAVLYQRGQPGLALAYVVTSVVVAVGGLFLGMYAVRLATA